MKKKSLKQVQKWYWNKDIFKAIIERIDPPDDNSKDNCRALIFDSMYDNYKGAIPYVRVFDGVLRRRYFKVLCTSKRI